MIPLRHIALAAILTLGSAATASALDCEAGLLSVERSSHDGYPVFRVDVVDNAMDLAKGLMWVESMPEDAGMLFVFPRSEEVSFWMKNTIIPLDMLFINEAGDIVNIHENAVPHDTTSIASGVAVRYVLEINGGMVEQHDLSVGDKVINPAIGTGCVMAESDNIRM